MKFFRKIKNYLFCLRYPFYKIRNNWDDKFMGYEYTLYTAIPDGWRSAFGKQFSKDLKKALKKDKLLKAFRFYDIKEKYGSLRLYCNFYGEETDKVITKYEKLSENYCIICGKKATHTTKGYILHLCNSCYEDHLKRLKGSNL